MNNNEITIIYGTDYKSMTIELLERIGLCDDIGQRNQRIGLKPNLVSASRPSEGATTHPEIVAGVIEYLQKNGFKNIEILESAWVGARTQDAFKTVGLDKVCEKYNVPFFDMKKERAISYDAKGMEIKLCERAASLDYMVNLPVMKGHCQTKITCSMKNLKGIIPDSEKRRFHSLGLHKPIAHLATLMPRGITVVDGICGDLDFEEGGNPVVMNRIFACKDPVLCDSYVCESMGYRSDDVEYITLASRLGVGSKDIGNAVITHINEGSFSSIDTTSSRKAERLSRYIDEDGACSACYGQLVFALNRLNSDGKLGRIKGRISIGQGFKGKDGKLGVGNCTKGFDCSLAGCPPTATQMYKFLSREE